MTRKKTPQAPEKIYLVCSDCSTSGSVWLATDEAFEEAKMLTESDACRSRPYAQSEFVASSLSLEAPRRSTDVHAVTAWDLCTHPAKALPTARVLRRHHARNQNHEDVYGMRVRRGNASTGRRGR